MKLRSRLFFMPNHEVSNVSTPSPCKIPQVATFFMNCWTSLTEHLCLCRVYILKPNWCDSWRWDLGDVVRSQVVGSCMNGISSPIRRGSRVSWLTQPHDILARDSHLETRKQIFTENAFQFGPPSSKTVWINITSAWDSPGGPAGAMGARSLLRALRSHMLTKHQNMLGNNIVTNSMRLQNMSLWSLLSLWCSVLASTSLECTYLPLSICHGLWILTKVHR